MKKTEFLTEEKYLQSKKKVKNMTLLVLIIGVLIGGSFITVGLINQSKVNSKYSDENKAKELKQLETKKQEIKEQIEIEKQNLINFKEELETKIKPVEDEIKSLDREKFTGFDEAYYARKDKIEELTKSISDDKKSIGIIEKVLNESFEYCFYDAINNTYTANYCSLKSQLVKNESEIFSLDSKYSVSNIKSESENYIPLYIIGGFILIVTLNISLSLYMVTKRREIAAFSAQQMMPIAQEGVEKMSSTIGKAGANIVKEMSTVYGEVAKDISKGIKEGLKEDEDKK